MVSRFKRLFWIWVLFQTVICFGQTKIDSLETQLQQATGKKKIDVLNQLADALQSREPLKSIQYAEEAIKLSEKIDYNKAIIVAYRTIGMAQGYNNDYKKAVDYLLISSELAEKNGELKILAQNYSQIGSAHYYIWGNHETGTSYYLKAFKIYEELNDKEGIAGIHMNMALVYHHEKKLDLALENDMKALSVYEELKDLKTLSKLYVNIGSIYSDKRDYQKAMEFYTKALKGFEQMNNTRGAAATLLNIAEIYEVQNDLDRAITTVNRALQLNELTNHQLSIATCLLDLGRLYEAKKQYDRAQSYLLRSEVIAKKLRNKEKLSTIYKHLTNVYKTKNDFKSALEYHELHSTYYDSVFTAEKSKQINEMQARFDTEKKEKEIVLLKQDQFLNRIYLFIALGLALTVCVIGLLIFNRQKLKIKKDRELAEKESQIQEERRTLMEAELRNREHELEFKNHELEFKNKELTSYTLNLIQKNELLENLKQCVEDIKDAEDGEVKQKLGALVNMVNYSFHLDKDWENFKIHFEHVHQDFFKKLADQYPDLNANDLKLCSLLKLNLDNRGIAAMLNISQESAKVARHRLRKKINLPAERDLVTFLHSLS